MKKTLVPEVREAMDKFKMEAARDVGVNLKQGYNGDLTAKQAGRSAVRRLKTLLPYEQVSASPSREQAVAQTDTRLPLVT